MSIKQNEQIIKKYFEEAWNQGKLEVLDKIIAPTYLNHSPGMPNPIPGPQGLKPIIAGLRKAFPDLHVVIENMVITETQVAIHCTMHGTHKDPKTRLPGRAFSQNLTLSLFNITISNNFYIQKIYTNLSI